MYAARASNSTMLPLPHRLALAVSLALTLGSGHAAAQPWSTHDIAALDPDAGGLLRVQGSVGTGAFGVPVAGGGRMPEPELDRLSNIIRAFNDQFGDIPWEDADRVRQLVTELIPERVAADDAYRNARENSDKQNARIEHDKALQRVMTAVMKDDTELFKQFMDNEGFKRWMADMVFGLTYVPGGG